MKRLLMLFVVLCASLCFAGGNDSLMSYYLGRSGAVSNNEAVIGQQGPYGYQANVSLASADWTAPATVSISGIYVGIAGEIKIATYTDTATWHCAKGFYIPVMARRIFKTGTTADSLVVLGKR
jgi:hypothetical protein